MVDRVVVPSLGPRRIPVVFGPAERPLTGFFHPAGGQAGPRELGVVLCDPLGYEALTAHRTYRHLAERLAADGFAALRFDYDGVGDSPAPSDDPGRVQAWVESIRAALVELRARAGVDRVALVGMRFGAALAAVAAHEDGHVDALIAWAPIVSGRAHVRELRAFRLVKGGAARADGGEEVGGFFFSKETLADMSAIDLATVEGKLADRALVLARTERAVDEAKLVASLEARGVCVRVLPDVGYAAMMRDDPYESVVPTATIDAVVAWLDENHPARPAASPTGRAQAHELRVVSVLPVAGRPALKETALVFGESARLFGVVTEPTSPVPPDRPAVCFLNVGANHHVGPHGMSVDLARDAAARGYLTLRFDVSGLGDSLAGPRTSENRIYTRDSVVDLQAAMDLLQARHGARRFVIVGLCSGAYLAYHTAAADARVVGQVLLSPYAFEWKEGDPVTPTEREVFHTFKSTRFYLRALLDKGVWRRALRGEINVRAIGGVVMERAHARLDAAIPSLVGFLTRTRGPKTEVERTFRALCERGVESLLVLGFSDGGLDMVARYLGNDARRMRGYANFSLQILADVDHTFTTMAAQAGLRTILSTYLAHRFA